MTCTADGLNRITAANANTFSYDGNGNLTSDSLTAYVYDVENRLVSASGQNTAGLRYDPFGRLYEVTDAQGGIRRFLHDGDDLVLEYGPTGTVLARHLHGLGSGDDPLISYTGANASYLDAEYLYTDRLGSVIARYRRDGTPAAINGYDEYGVPGPSSGVNNNGRFRYTGQVWLPELGLYYYKARMYSPTIGRFMQTDPIGYADGMNLYAYVGNDPVNGVDPTGLAIRTTKECTGTRIRRDRHTYDCNAMFAGTGPMPNPNAGFDATLGGGGSGVGGGGGRGGSTASCSGGPSNVINVCAKPNRGFAANNIGDHLGGLVDDFKPEIEIGLEELCKNGGVISVSSLAGDAAQRVLTVYFKNKGERIPAGYQKTGNGDYIRVDRGAKYVRWAARGARGGPLGAIAGAVTGHFIGEALEKEVKELCEKIEL